MTFDLQDDHAANPSWNPPPSHVPSHQQPEVYRPYNVTEQYKQPPPPPPPASELYKSTNAPQQFSDRPAVESSRDQYPQKPDVPDEFTGQRSRTASDPTCRGGQEEGEKRPGEFRQVPNGHVVNLPRSVSPTVTLLQYQRGKYSIFNLKLYIFLLIYDMLICYYIVFKILECY